MRQHWIIWILYTIKHMANHHGQSIIKHTHWAYKDLWNKIPTPIKFKTQFGKQGQPLKYQVQRIMHCLKLLTFKKAAYLALVTASMVCISPWIRWQKGGLFLGEQFLVSLYLKGGGERVSQKRWLYSGCSLRGPDTTVCNSSSRESKVLFWLLGIRHPSDIKIHIQAKHSYT